MAVNLNHIPAAPAAAPPPTDLGRPARRANDAGAAGMISRDRDRLYAIDRDYCVARESPINESDEAPVEAVAPPQEPYVWPLDESAQRAPANACIFPCRDYLPDFDYPEPAPPSDRSQITVRRSAAS